MCARGTPVWGWSPNLPPRDYSGDASCGKVLEAPEVIRVDRRSYRTGTFQKGERDPRAVFPHVRSQPRRGSSPAPRVPAPCSDSQPAELHSCCRRNSLFCYGRWSQVRQQFLSVSGHQLCVRARACEPVVTLHFTHWPLEGKRYRVRVTATSPARAVASATYEVLGLRLFYLEGCQRTGSLTQ